MVSQGLTYDELSKKYMDFSFPAASVIVKGKNFDDNKDNFIINSLEIELSSGYEASAAELRIYYVYDDGSGQFLAEALSSYMELGADISIGVGYLSSTTEVFKGFISGITYGYEGGDLPYVRVTAMDIKGIMMANHESRQLKSGSYGEAVQEILNKSVYAKLAEKLEVSATPDKKEGGGNKTSSDTVEMTAESDYEFVVKAAMRFNYEFFTDCGRVIFRKAKSQTGTLAVLGLNQGLTSFDISYRLDGLTESVEVRCLDPGTGKLLTSKGKRTGKISLGNMAAKLLTKSQKVVADPSAVSQEQLNARRDSLLESMSYRFGELNCECVGIPELVPGRFVKIEGLGDGVSNQFYITKVVHRLGDEGFRTRLEGAAAQL